MVNESVRRLWKSQAATLENLSKDTMLYVARVECCDRYRETAAARQKDKTNISG